MVTDRVAVLKISTLVFGALLVSGRVLVPIIFPPDPPEQAFPVGLLLEQGRGQFAPLSHEFGLVGYGMGTGMMVVRVSVLKMVSTEGRMNTVSVVVRGGLCGWFWSWQSPPL